MSNSISPVPAKFSFKQVAGDPLVGIAQAQPVTAPVTVAPAAEITGSPPANAVPSAAVATVPPAQNAVTEYRAPVSYGDDSDDIGGEDINTPRLNIVQKVGDLSNQFTEGDILLNGQLVIAKSPKTLGKGIPPEKIKIVVCGFRPDRFAEQVEGGAKGLLFDTEAEVYTAGGTMNYNEAKATGKKLFKTVAECLALIEKPENCNDETAFPYLADGKFYAAVKWSLKGAAFTNGAKVLRTARKAGWLMDKVNPADGSIVEKRGYPFGVWELNTFLKGYDTGNFAWIPVLIRAGETTPAVRELALKVIG